MSKKTKKLLTEGGVAGHLMHLYDNPEMTASKMTDILTAAASGELVGTEKTDGFNIYLGFVDGEARYARNKGDMRKGGGTMQDLMDRKFAGGDKIKKIYLDAFDAFAKAMGSLSPEEADELFLNDSQNSIFLNTEIQGPGANNLVNYDANVLSIHATGHKFYDAQTDTVVNADGAVVSRIATKIDSLVDRFEEATTGVPFNVRRTAVMHLQGISEGTALEDVLYRISQAGFTGDMTIHEYVNNKLTPIIQRAIPSATDELLGHILDHIRGTKGRKNLRLVRKMLSGPDEGAALTSLLDRKSALLKDAIAPIEEAIHDFAVELLRGVESAYILDNSAEMKRVRADVRDAINQIADYSGPGSDEAQEILIKQLRKIKSHENITSAVEGFVFSYDGNTYKFTGNFAPANQILGLFKYGRGSAPPIARANSSEESSEPINEAEATPPAVSVEPTKRKVAVIPGGFKSPHRGHFAMAQKYAGMVDKVIVFVSPLSRPTPSGREITSEDSVQLWNEYISAYGLQDKIDVKVSTINSPVRLVFDFVANGWDNRKEKQVSEPNPDYAHAGDMVILGVSTKGGDDSRFTASAQQYAHPKVRVAAGREYAVAATGDEFVHSQTGEPLSASHMRSTEDSPEAAAERQRLGHPEDPIQALTEFLPTRLKKDAARIHASLFGKQEMVAESLTELIKSALIEAYSKEAVKEISAMGAAGGGAVEGHSGAGQQNKNEEEGYPLGGKKRKKRRNTLIREEGEEGFWSREEMIQMIVDWQQEMGHSWVEYDVEELQNMSDEELTAHYHKIEDQHIDWWNQERVEDDLDDLYDDEEGMHALGGPDNPYYKYSVREDPIEMKEWFVAAERLISTQGKEHDLLYEGLASTFKEGWNTVKELAQDMGADIKTVVKALKANNGIIWRIFKAAGWSLKTLFSAAKQGLKLYKDLQMAIANFLTEAPGIKAAFEAGGDILEYVDQFFEKNPNLKKAGGLAVAGILLLIWMNMSFTGDFDFDFDNEMLIGAFMGNFDLTDIFTSPDGQRMLILLATGSLAGLSFPWLKTATSARKFGISLLYTAGKWVGKEVAELGVDKAKDVIDKRKQAKQVQAEPEPVTEAACGDNDEVWRSKGHRMPSKINTLDYPERAPHYAPGDDVEPPTSPIIADDDELINKIIAALAATG